MLTTKAKLKDTCVLFFINILLTSADIFSDLHLIVKLLGMEKGNARIWGYFLLIPLISNYILTYFAWFRLDHNKPWLSVLAVTFNLYPQYLACEVIFLLWNDTEKALKKKRRMQREFLQFETFVENLPTLLILAYMCTQWKRSLSEEVSNLIIGGSDAADPSFALTITTSTLALGVGFYRTLVVGPCRAHTKSNFFVILLFISVICAYLCKLTFTCVILNHIQYITGHRDQFDSWMIFRDAMLPFLPQLMIALLALPSRTIITHPSLVMLPLFTWYTFSDSNSCCSTATKYIDESIFCTISETLNGKFQPSVTEVNEKQTRGLKQSQESFIRFSPEWTLLNIGSTVVITIIQTILWKFWEHHGTSFGMTLSVLVPGMLFTFWVAIDDKHGRQCIQWRVYKPSDANTEYILTRSDNMNSMIKDWKAATSIDSDVDTGVQQELAESKHVFSLWSLEFEIQMSQPFEIQTTRCLDTYSEIFGQYSAVSL